MRKERQTEYIRSQLWHRYFTIIDKVMMPNHWFSNLLLAVILYQGHPDRKPDFWNTDRYIHHTQVLLECYCIKMESSQYENWNNFFRSHSQFIYEGMNMRCPLFQVHNQHSHQTYLVIRYRARKMNSQCMCFRFIKFASFCDFWLDFGTVATVWYFLFFILLHVNSS